MIHHDWDKAGRTFVPGSGRIASYVDDTLSWYTDTYNCLGVLVERFEPPWGVGFTPDTEHVDVLLDERITEVGEDAFLGCDALRRVTIPNPHCTIDDCAFRGCSNVTIAAPAGSPAEAFVNQKGGDFRFVPLEKKNAL